MNKSLLLFATSATELRQSQKHEVYFNVFQSERSLYSRLVLKYMQKNSFLNSKISKHNTINIPAKKVSLQKITDAREKSTHLQSQKQCTTWFTMDRNIKLCRSILEAVWILLENISIFAMLFRLIWVYFGIFSLLFFGNSPLFPAKQQWKSTQNTSQIIPK